MQPDNYYHITTMQRPIHLLIPPHCSNQDRPCSTQPNAKEQPSKISQDFHPRSPPPSTHFSTARNATMTSSAVGPAPIGRAPARVDAVVSTQRHQPPRASRATTDPVGTDGSPGRRILASERTICHVMMMVVSPVTLLMMMKMIF